MTVGTKEYYVESFKHVLMTNSISTKSTPLTTIFTFHEEEIGNAPHLNDQEKIIYTHNLQQAFKQTKDDILGSLEE